MPHAPLPRTRRTHRRLHNAIVHGVPWDQLMPNMLSLINADLALVRWWSDGAIGDPPLEASSSWHDMVGHHVPPSEMGRMFRRVGYAMLQGKPLEWEADGRLAAAVLDHRHERHAPPEDDYDYDEAQETSDTPWRFTHSFLDGRNRTGSSRRMTEVFGQGMFGGILPVPSSANSSRNSLERETATLKKSSADFVEQLVSYLVYNVFLCYLYKPEQTHPVGSLNDGSEIKTHRSSHACWPAIPFDLPELQTFYNYTGVDPGEWHAKALEEHPKEPWLFYEDWCHTKSVRTARESAEWFITRLNWPTGSPQAIAMRRLFENPVAAFSSFSNLGLAFSEPAGSFEKMRSVACSFSRLNAVIWFAMFVTVLIGFYLTCCWPCLNLASLLIYFCCCCGMFRGGGKKSKKTGGAGAGAGAGAGTETLGPNSSPDIGVRRRQRRRPLPTVADMWLGAAPVEGKPVRSNAGVQMRPHHAPRNSTVHMLRHGHVQKSWDSDDEFE